MSNKPIVGIVLARVPEDHRFQPEPAYRFQFLKAQYFEPLEAQGLLPIAIPGTVQLENIPHYCDLISGLLLIGGEDINPECYNEPIDPLTHTLTPERDLIEIDLIRVCLKRGTPILGICRGLQILNVACGGTLHQDLSYCIGAGDHRQTGELDFSTQHTVQVVRDTTLHKIIREDRISTNTGHHQCVKTLGEGLRVSARSQDGVIEAVEGDDFTIAVQWHPESWASDEASRRLFTAFAAAVAAGNSRTSAAL